MRVDLLAPLSYLILMENENTYSSGTDEIEPQSATKPKRKVKKPRKWKVLILNDDFTPMDFVVGILVRYFGRNIEDATGIMKTIHQKGVGLANVYTFEIAEAKIAQVSGVARHNQFPLRLTVEPEDSEDE